MTGSRGCCCTRRRWWGVPLLLVVHKCPPRNPSHGRRPSVMWSCRRRLFQQWRLGTRTALGGNFDCGLDGRRGGQGIRIKLGGKKQGREREKSREPHGGKGGVGVFLPRKSQRYTVAGVDDAVQQFADTADLAASGVLLCSYNISR